MKIIWTGLFCCVSLVIAKGQSAWSDSLLLTPEKNSFQETSTYKDVMRFLQVLSRRSDNLYLFSMGKSLEGKEIPVAVLAEPPIRSLQEAKLSSKLVIYIQGNIHAGEVEGKEAIMTLMRDILLGDKKYLLDSQIILFVPIYNTDANDKMAKGLRPSQEDSPMETGERESSEGYDLNRDGVKFEARETRALFENVIVPWDPQIFVDLHTTNGTWHAYSLTWAPSYHSAGEYSSYDYTNNRMLPAITENVRKKYGLRFGVYGDYELGEAWPPQNFYTYSHKPRYLVNQFGLRNRMAILSEAFAHDRFYERINSTYVFMTEILAYSQSHASEIIRINQEAEEQSIQNVLNNSGKAVKGVSYKMTPLKILDSFLTYDYTGVKDTSGKISYYRSGKIVTYNHVTYHARFEPGCESTLPRGYVIPKEFENIVRILQQHGIKVTPLTKDRKFYGETFIVDSLKNDAQSFQKHQLSTLFGNFKMEERRFRKGDYLVDLAQPLSNLIFYMLEPQSDDGLASWNFFDLAIKKQLLTAPRAEFPIFKYYR